MLVLSRRVNERITIGHDITITVVDTLGASAINTLTIKDNGKGGAGC